MGQISAVTWFLLLAFAACENGTEVVGEVVPFEYHKAPAPPALTGELPTGPERTPDTPGCREGSFEVSVESSDAEMEVFKVHMSNDLPVCFLQFAPGLNITPSEGRPFVAGRVQRELPAFLLFRGADFRATLYAEGCKEDAAGIAPFEAFIVMRDGETIPLGSFEEDGCPEGAPLALRLGGWVLYPPDSPNALEDLRVTAFDVPEEVRGQTLEFVVQVANEGDENFAFDPCPVYRAAFGEGGISFDILSYLNCDAAPDTIATNQAVRFAIELPIERRQIDDLSVGSLVFSLFDDMGGSVDLEESYEIKLLR